VTCLCANLEENTYANSSGTRELMETQYATLKSVLSDLGLAK
jgi:hypothetical protein